MPKFKSVMYDYKTKDAAGNEKIIQRSAWVPLDDSAKITDHAEEAEQVGLWEREKGEEPKKIKLKMFKTMLEDMAKKGFISESDVKTRVAMRELIMR